MVSGVIYTLFGQRLLETTGKPTDLIAQEAGFGSDASLRQHFNKALKISPTRYQEFQGVADIQPIA